MMLAIKWQALDLCDESHPGLLTPLDEFGDVLYCLSCPPGKDDQVED